MCEYVKTWMSLGKDRRAVTALEYGLIAAAIAGVVVTMFGTIGANLLTTLTNLSTHV